MSRICPHFSEYVFTVVVTAILWACAMVAVTLFGDALFTTREAGQGPTSTSSYQPGVRAPRGSSFPDLTVSGSQLSADCRIEPPAPGTLRMGRLGYPCVLRPVKQYGALRQAPTLSADSKILPTTRKHARPAIDASGTVASAAAGMGVSPAADLS